MESGHRLKAQKIILRELKTEVGGAAAAYGRTFAGSISRARETLLNLLGVLGAKLAPTIRRVADWIARFAQGLQDGTGAGGTFRGVLGRVWDALRPLGAGFSSLVTVVRRHWPEISAVARTVFAGVRSYLNAVVQNFKTNVLPIILGVVKTARSLWHRFGGDITSALGLALRVVQRAAAVISGIITGFLAVLRGDWGTAWSSLKKVVSNALGGVWDLLRHAPGILLSVVGKIGGAIVSGIVGGVKAIGRRITEAILAPIRAVIGALPDPVKQLLGISTPGATLSDTVRANARAAGAITAPGAAPPNAFSGNPAVASRSVADTVGREAAGVAAPGLATGGRVRRPGWSWVGEQGPELNYMPRGSVVVPEARAASAVPFPRAGRVGAPRVAPLDWSAMPMLEVTINHTATMDGDVVARSVDRSVAKARARR